MDGQKQQSLLVMGMVGAMLLAGCSSASFVSRSENKSFDSASTYNFEDEESSNQSVMYQDQIWEGQSSFQLPSDEQKISESAITLRSFNGSDLLESEYMSPIMGASLLKDVYFEYDRFSLQEEAMDALERNARVLNADKDVTVIVEGHTDERGTMDYNLVLGERRARVVQQYLKELGVPSSKVHIVSFGKEKPFCHGENEDCRKQNRRVHFVQK